MKRAKKLKKLQQAEMADDCCCCADDCAIVTEDLPKPELAFKFSFVSSNLLNSNKCVVGVWSRSYFYIT